MRKVFGDNFIKSEPIPKQVKDLPEHDSRAPDHRFTVAKSWVNDNTFKHNKHLLIGRNYSIQLPVSQYAFGYNLDGSSPSSSPVEKKEASTPREITESDFLEVGIVYKDGIFRLSSTTQQTSINAVELVDLLNSALQQIQALVPLPQGPPVNIAVVSQLGVLAGKYITSRDKAYIVFDLAFVEVLLQNKETHQEAVVRILAEAISELLNHTDKIHSLLKEKIEKSKIVLQNGLPVYKKLIQANNEVNQFLREVSLPQLEQYFSKLEKLAQSNFIIKRLRLLELVNKYKVRVYHPAIDKEIWQNTLRDMFTSFKVYLVTVALASIISFIFGLFNIQEDGFFSRAGFFCFILLPLMAPVLTKLKLSKENGPKYGLKPYGLLFFILRKALSILKLFPSLCFATESVSRFISIKSSNDIVNGILSGLAAIGFYIIYFRIIDKKPITFIKKEDLKALLRKSGLKSYPDINYSRSSSPVGEGSFVVVCPLLFIVGASAIGFGILGIGLLIWRLVSPRTWKLCDLWAKKDIRNDLLDYREQLFIQLTKAKRDMESLKQLQAGLAKLEFINNNDSLRKLLASFNRTLLSDLKKSEKKARVIAKELTSNSKKLRKVDEQIMELNYDLAKLIASSPIDSDAAPSSSPVLSTEIKLIPIAINPRRKHFERYEKFTPVRFTLSINNGRPEFEFIQGSLSEQEQNNFIKLIEGTLPSQEVKPVLIEITPDTDLTEQQFKFVAQYIQRNNALPIVKLYPICLEIAKTLDKSLHVHNSREFLKIIWRYVYNLYYIEGISEKDAREKIGKEIESVRGGEAALFILNPKNKNGIHYLGNWSEDFGPSIDFINEQLLSHILRNYTLPAGGWAKRVLKGMGFAKERIDEWTLPFSRIEKIAEKEIKDFRGLKSSLKLIDAIKGDLRKMLDDIQKIIILLGNQGRDVAKLHANMQMVYE